MSEEIVNRVQKSGLVTIDLDDIELPKNIFEIDIKCWLHEGLFLKEKEFRASVHSHDWSKYKNSYVYVHCSSDAIVPTWAYMLVSSQLENRTNKVTIGGKEKFYEIVFLCIEYFTFQSQYNKPKVDEETLRGGGSKSSRNSQPETLLQELEAIKRKRQQLTEQ